MFKDFQPSNVIHGDIQCPSRGHDDKRKGQFQAWRQLHRLPQYQLVATERNQLRLASPFPLL